MRDAAAQLLQEEGHAMEMNRNRSNGDKSNAPFQHLHHTMVAMNDDFLFQPPDLIIHDIKIPNSNTDILDSYKTVCKDGSLSTFKDFSNSEPRTSHFLNQGLNIALQTANLEISKDLPSAGASISRVTPIQILSAP